ncbi:MAG: spore coat associated protein CotJA [Clostridia bacterium]|nr:spore coat associated protein CotJA [Clostridia bacterium]
MNNQSTQNQSKPIVTAQNILSALPSDFTVTMAYVPMQTDTTVYDADKALREGTLFPTLNKPFAGVGDRR